MLVSIQKLRFKSDFMFIYIDVLLSSSQSNSAYVYACPAMHRLMHMCKSEQLTWDYDTTKKVV